VANKPTPRQLRYLKQLAEHTGQTFTYPHTFTEAGREIDRLKAIRPESRAERRIERKQIADQLATGPEDCARVRDDEISGRGSSATWAHNRDRDARPGSNRAAPKRTTPVVGKRTELARYTVAADRLRPANRRHRPFSAEGTRRSRLRPGRRRGRHPWCSWLAADRRTRVRSTTETTEQRLAIFRAAAKP
jgi:hypothetical protein